VGKRARRASRTFVVADRHKVVGYYRAGAYDERTPLMREIHEGI
jgi:hypothetical protein